MMDRRMEVNTGVPNTRDPPLPSQQKKCWGSPPPLPTKEEERLTLTSVTAMSTTLPTTMRASKVFQASQK